MWTERSRRWATSKQFFFYHQLFVSSLFVDFEHKSIFTSFADWFYGRHSIFLSFLHLFLLFCSPSFRRLVIHTHTNACPDTRSPIDNSPKITRASRCVHQRTRACAHMWSCRPTSRRLFWNFHAQACEYVHTCGYVCVCADYLSFSKTQFGDCSLTAST